MLRLYAKKISSVQTYGWVSLLKALAMVHLTCDPDYKDDIKLAILWTVERCDCGTYQFAILLTVY
ncbi:MAG: hypothetical protein ACO2PN_20340 [Pyrobaculum sp.]|jgi:hypothetical protein